MKKYLAISLALMFLAILFTVVVYVLILDETQFSVL